MQGTSQVVAQNTQEDLPPALALHGVVLHGFSHRLVNRFVEPCDVLDGMGSDGMGLGPSAKDA